MYLVSIVCVCGIYQPLSSMMSYYDVIPLQGLVLISSHAIYVYAWSLVVMYHFIMVNLTVIHK